MKKSKKKVTAPLSYDPGKGRPKEYLAYLNWQEMQELQRINGGNMEFGPKGLPSFPPSGTTGKSSSSGTGARGPTGPQGQARSSPAGDRGGAPGVVSRTSTASKSSTSSGTGARGPTGPQGQARTTPGSVGGTRGSQAGTGTGGGLNRDLGIAGVSGGASRQGTAQAAYRGSQVTTGGGRSTGPSSSLNAPARTQPSTDAKSRQMAAERDASRALRSTPSLRNDAAAGGINQIRVGPMGNPVDMDGRVRGAISSVAAQTYTPPSVAMDPSIPGRVAQANQNYRTVTAPGGYVSRVYSDPDIKRSTLGESLTGFGSSVADTVSQYGRYAADAAYRAAQTVGGYLPSGISPYATTTTADLQRIGMAYKPPGKPIQDRVPQTLKPIQDRVPQTEIHTKTRVSVPAQKYGAQIGPQQPSTEQLESEIRGIMNETYAPYEPRFSTEQTLRGYAQERARRLGGVTAVAPERPVDSRASMEQTLRDYQAARSVTIPDSGVRKTTTAYSEMGPVRIDPSVMGRAAQAEANYRTVTGAGLGAGVAAREYIDPDIARSRSLGEVFNDAARNVSDYFRSPPATLAPYQQPTEMTPEERAAINNLRDRYALYNASVTPKMSPVVEQAAPVAGSEFAKSPTPGFGKLYSDRLPQAEGGVASLVSTSPSTTTAFRTPAPSEGEKVISVENVPVQVERARRGTEVVTNIFKTNPRTLAADLRNQVTDEINARRPTSENAAIGVPGPETPSYDTTDGYNASPSQGGLTEEQRKKAEKTLNRSGAVVRGTTTAAGLATGLPVGTVAGKTYNAYKKATLEKLENYAAMTPSEKFAAEEKNPELVGWAGRLGIEAQHDQSYYRNWAERSGLIGSGATSGGGRDPSGGIASLPYSTGTTPAKPPSSGGESGGGSSGSGSGSSSSGERPYIYYQWDLGINIPSPGDPKYTEYQKYLANRVAAQAAFG